MKAFLVSLKYKYDIGVSVFQVVMFGFMSISASPKIQELVPIPAKWLILILFFGSLAVTIVAGHLLDKTRFIEQYNKEANSRNEMLLEIQKQEKVLAKILLKLEEEVKWKS